MNPVGEDRCCAHQLTKIGEVNFRDENNRIVLAMIDMADRRALS
jgi:hypothetical protein